MQVSPATQEKTINRPFEDSLMEDAKVAKEGKKGFFICRVAANEKAALSKTMSRFWTIPLLRVFNFAYFGPSWFKFSCFFRQGFRSKRLIKTLGCDV
jgi:hypothetical protein